MSSWLTDFASRAETILNKLDQNTATVLKQQKSEFDDKSIEVNYVEEKLPSIRRNLSSNSLRLSSRNSTPQKVNSMNSSMSSRKSTADLTIETENTLVIPIGDDQASDTSNPSIELFHEQISGPSDIGQELAALRIVLSETKQERDDLKYELEQLKAESNTKSSVQSRIRELEEMNAYLVQERIQLVERIDGLGNSNKGYITTITELEMSVAKLHKNEVDLNDKLSWAKRETDQAIAELQQYRLRAQSTLQMKEQLIDQLKTSGGTIPAISDGSPVQNIASNTESFELNNLKKENDNLMLELTHTQEQLDRAREYISKLENRQDQVEQEKEQKISSLNESLIKEQFRYNQLQEKLRTQQIELNGVKDELSKQKSNVGLKMKEQQEEIMKLKSRITTRGGSSESNVLEDRVQSLTQSLVKKQTSLESVTAERNALRLQLEKLENKHDNMIKQLGGSQRPQILNMNDTDDAKAQLPIFMQENPFDTRVARRVKRAYSSLDSAGVRIGVLLRRYPLIRIFVVFYIVVLHIWVMFVLVAGTPTT